MKKVPRVIRSSDVVSEVTMNIKTASRGPFAGATLILPMVVGSSDLGSGVLTYTFSSIKIDFEIE
jgi:hypothetical protein